jgi:hypothetical protein
MALEEKARFRARMSARQFSIALHAEGLTPIRPPGKRRGG